MLKKLLSVLSLFVIMLFTSCTDGGIKNQTIVTACMTERTNDGCKYSFYIPNVETKEEKEESHGMSYSFYSENFAMAVSELRKLCGETDLTHLNAFVSDISYLSSELKDDMLHIKKNIKISPLIKFYISEIGSEKFFENINKTFHSDMSKMSEFMFSGESSQLLCTLSEIVYAYQNTLFTASIPVIETDNDTGNLNSRAALFHNFYIGNAVMLDEDYKTYKKFIEKYGKTSEPFAYSLNDGRINVEFKSNDKNSRSVADVARRYSEMGFDVMNSVFFSKKCFPDYKTYVEFVGSLSTDSIEYTVRK